MEKTIAVIATLDTKGAEIKYVKQRIEAAGLKTLIIDSGIRGKPIDLVPDIDRHQVARAAGRTIEELVPLPRGVAVHHLTDGLRKLVLQLYRENRIDGVLSIGGLEGTVLGTAAMKVLPLGVPKLMVSPMASGTYQFGPFVGEKDVMILHSVTDILGVNPLSKTIFDNAINAMVGMVRGSTLPIDWGTKKLIAVTMMGNTTPAVMIMKKLFEEAGYNLVIFHANGTGGKSMESLVRDGVFAAVLDFTPHEITDFIAGGGCAGGPERLDAACETGIPQIIVPGGMDYIVQGRQEDIAAKFIGRPFYPHNPVTVLVRTSGDEMDLAGRFIADKLNKARGPAAVVVPTRGFSMYCHPGEPMHDPCSDARLMSSLRENLDPAVVYEEVDAHINDESFARRVFEVTMGILAK